MFIHRVYLKLHFNMPQYMKVELYKHSEVAVKPVYA
jgi:hypothetical protein